MQINSDSDFLKILHEESVPKGYLDQNTHCSVLRAKTWIGQDQSFEKINNFQDFAIIRTNDNVNKILEIVKLLYSVPLLLPIKFIGERRGNFLIIIDRKQVAQFSGHWFRSYQSQVKKTIKKLNKAWTSTVAIINPPGSHPTGFELLIKADFDWNLNYLKEMDARWDLGHSLLNFP